jgi:hypothetical protein
MKIKSLPKPKKVSISKLKKKAWEAFSKYIRIRDCLKTTGSIEQGVCITCKKVYEIKHLQAGHFIPGRHNSILFDERGVNAQCMACNVYLKGNPIKYWRYMECTYGNDVIKELEQKDRQEKQFKPFELQAIYESYKDLTKYLLDI